MRHAELLAHYDEDLRAHWVMPEAQREEVQGPDGRVALVRWLRPDVGTSTVLYSDLQRYGRQDVEAVVDANLALEQRRGMTSYWKLHDHDAPLGLRKVLALRGYVSGAVLIARLREAARRGVSFAVVEPSPMNVPIVGRFGFEVFTRAVDLVHRTEPTKPGSSL